MLDPEPEAAPESGASTIISEGALAQEIIRLSRNVLGLTLGFLCAAGLFLATNILVLKDGPHVGEHLQLLSQFFPGYKVTFLGSLLGLIYGFVAGYLSGWVIAAIYNRVVLIRHRF